MKAKHIRDHFGHSFKSLGSMAKAYGIEPDRLRKRLYAGWDIRRALTTPIKESRYNCPVIAPNGVKYANYKLMCKAYKVPYDRFRCRLNIRGWDMEQALSPYKFSGASITSSTDHLGKKYHSLSEMARAYGLTPTCLSGRLNKGWDIKRALTTPPKIKKYKALRSEYDHGLDNID